MQGDEAVPESFRIELSSENDLFFHYQHVVDIEAFRKVSEGWTGHMMNYSHTFDHR
jgi:hypothetical protein